MNMIEQCAKLVALADEVYGAALRNLPSVKERSTEQQMALNSLQDTKRRATDAWRSAMLADAEWHPLKSYPKPMDYRSEA